MITTASAQSQQQRAITIGVVDGNAASQKLAQSICALVNGGSPEHGILCSTPSHTDDKANLAALRTGEQTMAVLMSDQHAFAYEGRDRFEGTPFQDMRSILSAQAQAFTLVARKSAGIASLDDLKNRTINIGHPDKPQRLLMNTVLTAKSWDLSEFAATLELKGRDQIAALCNGKADAVVFASTPPDPLVQEALDTCNASIVPAEEDDIISLIDNTSHYTQVAIPSGTYKSLDDDVNTFGLRSTLVASKSADRQLVYDVVEIIFENLDKLRSFDPAFETLDELDMTRSGLTAPLHNGALYFFREEDLH
ncbi:MAG: TAXI family TRAP transporter solute-binding subunit [Hyphomicrobiales bacterium]|nr:TAXI family TRAP transporter solute-binding subunit [Hyphomicrobiales bacterium]